MKNPWLRAGTFALVALVVIAAGVRWLAPLAALPASMKTMVATTHDILAETEAMQTEVGRVQAGLSGLQQQEALLDRQAKLMAELLGQLSTQERLAGEARGLLTDILATEKTTVALTGQADQKGAATRQTVAASSAQLARLSAAAGSIQQGSSTVNGQMDTLLSRMGDTQAEFAPVGRLKRAASGVLERAGNWLQSLVRYFHG